MLVPVALLSAVSQRTQIEHNNKEVSASFHYPCTLRRDNPPSAPLRIRYVRFCPYST